jgi:hypothetical protein
VSVVFVARRVSIATPLFMLARTPDRFGIGNSFNVVTRLSVTQLLMAIACQAGEKANAALSTMLQGLSNVGTTYELS